MAVRNVDILAVLTDLGYDLGPVSATGGQTTAFRDRILKALRAATPVGGDLGAAERVWSNAVAVASYQPSGDKTRDAEQLLVSSGVDDDTRSRIATRADELARRRPGVNKGKFGPTEYAQAAREVLGADSPLLSTAIRRSGIPVSNDYFAAPTGQPGHQGALEGGTAGATRKMPGALAGGQAGARAGNTPTGALAGGLAGIAAGTAKPAPPASAPAGGAGGGGAGGGGGGGGGAVNQHVDLGVDLNDPEAVRSLIASRYGGFDVLLDNPEVAGIMERVMKGDISAEEASRLFKSTNYYKTTTAAEREWTVFERTSPGDAARSVANQGTIIGALFQEAGITPSTDRLNKVVDLSLRYGWTDAEVKRFVASEVKYDPDNVKGGTLGQLKDLVREWLVPLSDQAMSSWASSIVSGDKTTEEFTVYLREQAKSMFPGAAVGLDDPNMTTRRYLDPYAQDTARTLGMNAEDIDWNDPKWMRAINQVDEKTGQRKVMSRADWVTTLMNDPMYEYDKSENGIKAKQSFTNGLMESFGISI